MTQPYFSDKRYIHNWVNHSVGFVDPNDKSIHTNNIENRWSKLRKFTKRNILEDHIRIYINNFLFFYHFRKKRYVYYID